QVYSLVPAHGWTARAATHRHAPLAGAFPGRRAGDARLRCLLHRKRRPGSAVRRRRDRLLPRRQRRRVPDAPAAGRHERRLGPARSVAPGAAFRWLLVLRLPAEHRHRRGDHASGRRRERPGPDPAARGRRGSHRPRHARVRRAGPGGRPRCLRRMGRGRHACRARGREPGGDADRGELVRRRCRRKRLGTRRGAPTDPALPGGRRRSDGAPAHDQRNDRGPRAGARRLDRRARVGIRRRLEAPAPQLRRGRERERRGADLRADGVAGTGDERRCPGASVSVGAVDADDRRRARPRRRAAGDGRKRRGVRERRRNAGARAQARKRAPGCHPGLRRAQAELAEDERNAARGGPARTAAREKGRGRRPHLHRHAGGVPGARTEQLGRSQAVRRPRRRLGRDGSAVSIPARRLLALPARRDPERRLRRPLRPGGELMSARDMSISGLSAAVAFAVAFALTTATGALAYHTHFVQNNCFVKGGISIYPKSRYASLDWGYTAAYEGYQWGGGCWNMNDVDVSPGDPTEDPATGGEGPDCSGLVFKSWFESSDQTRTDFWKWSTYNFV